MTDYHGPERRSNFGMKEDERDLLIRVDKNLSNLILRFGNHAESDDKRFTEFTGRLKVIERITYLGLGGLAVIEFLSRFVKP